MNAQHEKIRLLLLDDAPLFRVGLKEILNAVADLEVVGEAENDQSGVDLCRDVLPDVAVVGWEAQRFCASDAIVRLRYTRPEMRVLVLAAADDESILRAVFHAGAAGLTLKSAARDQIVSDVRRISRGRMVIPEELLRMVMEDYLTREPPCKEGAECLTAREREVLRCLSTGASNKDISGALGISPNTVQNHVVNILRKLRLENRVQATAYAVRNRLTPDGRGRDAGAITVQK